MYIHMCIIALPGFCTYVVIVDSAVLWCMSTKATLVFNQMLLTGLCL